MTEHLSRRLQMNCRNVSLRGGGKGGGNITTDNVDALLDEIGDQSD